MQAERIINRSSLHSVWDYLVKTSGSLSIGKLDHFQRGQQGSVSFGISNTPGNLPIHLFRPWAVDVVGAEAGLDMAHGDLLLECGEGCCGAGSRVAMDKNHIGGGFLEHITHAGQDAGGNVVQVLSLFHDVQIIVGLDLKDFEHLVQHLSVLAGHAYDGFELIRMLLELLHQRAHLDGLWAGTEDEHNFLHYGGFIDKRHFLALKKSFASNSDFNARSILSAISVNTFA